MPLKRVSIVLAAAAWALAPREAAAATRDLANVPTFTLTFGRSVLNQLTYDTYRTPFDELQTRPYNLLFANISRQPNFGAWPGQQGGYARYVDGLIGNNGAANVDNDADAIEGTMIRRESGALAWGLSAAILAGTLKTDDAAAGATFSDNNDLKALDVRGGAAYQLSNSTVLGAGLRTVYAIHDATDANFEPGVGGFNGEDNFKQLTMAADVGARQFLTPTSSWEVTGVFGYGSSNKDVFSENVDGTGAITDRFVSTNYDINDLNLTVAGGYNRLRSEGLGETEFRGGVSYSQRKLGNSDLASTTTGGVTTPDLTLLSQKPITTTGIFGSARSIFQAGETEVFLGVRLGYDSASGSQQTDAAGTIVNEKIDDSLIGLGLTLGVRQPLFHDKLRIIVSGHGDLLAGKTGTIFDTGSAKDDTTLTVAQYAVGLEAVLANVTLDFAWLTGEEATVTPVPIGIPAGSRRTVQLDKLVLSAAVSW
jgi:hypothetical protein